MFVRQVRAYPRLVAALAAAWSLDFVIAAIRGPWQLVVLPGAAAMAIVAVLLVSRPVAAAASGAGILVAHSSVIFMLNRWVLDDRLQPFGLGIDTVLLSETLTGVALVVLVLWQARLVPAVGTTVLLVTCCLLALPGRGLDLGQPLFRSLIAGAVLFTLAVAIGGYLRGGRRAALESPRRMLLRRQLPVAAVLGLLVMLDAVASLGTHPARFGVVLGSAVIAALTVLIPVRPLRIALLVAGVALGMAVVVRVLGLTSGTVPITQVGAWLVALAYLVRLAPARDAAWGPAMLVAAAGATAALYIWPAAGLDNDSAGGGALIAGSLLGVSAVATGLYFRARDRERERLVSDAQQAERMELARELHDVVAHYVTGMVVTANAARMVTEQDPRAAAGALERVATSGTEALAAMRRLVGTLRGGGTMDLSADLREVTKASVVPARLEQHLDRPVPMEVAGSVLRVVTEALTNVAKHAAGATMVTVYVASADDEVQVRVADDGQGSTSLPDGDSGGYGLVGMAERVELLGGRLRTGPSEYGGWRVEAWLPLSRPPSRS